MGLSEGQRKRWKTYVVLLRRYPRNAGLDETEVLVDTTLAVAAHMEELEAEVERLREALRAIEGADVQGWDDGGRLAAMCQRIAQEALQEASDGC